MAHCDTMDMPPRQGSFGPTSVGDRSVHVLLRFPHGSRLWTTLVPLHWSHLSQSCFPQQLTQRTRALSVLRFALVHAEDRGTEVLLHAHADAVVPTATSSKVR